MCTTDDENLGDLDDSSSNSNAYRNSLIHLGVVHEVERWFQVESADDRFSTSLILSHTCAEDEIDVAVLVFHIHEEWDLFDGSNGSCTHLEENMV